MYEGHHYNHSGMVNNAPYRNPNALHSINLFRVGYGLTATIYLVAIFILFSVTYPNLMKDGVVFDSAYGVIMCWNLSKLFLLSLMVFCCLCSKMPLYMAMLCAAAAASVLLGSLAFLILLLLDTLFVANSAGSNPRHPANSPLFCCIYYENNLACLNLGPCINVNLTATNIPPPLVGYDSSDDENITFVTKDHLQLDSVFQFSLFLMLAIFLIELVIVFSFTHILKSVNSGKGLFYEMSMDMGRTATPEDFGERDSRGTKFILKQNTIVPKKKKKKGESAKEEEEEEEVENAEIEQDIPKDSKKIAAIRSRFRSTQTDKKEERDKPVWTNNEPQTMNTRYNIRDGIIRTLSWVRRQWFEIGILAKSILVLNSEDPEEENENERTVNNTTRPYTITTNYSPIHQQQHQQQDINFYFANHPTSSHYYSRQPAPIPQYWNGGESGNSQNLDASAEFSHRFGVGEGENW